MVNSNTTISNGIKSWFIQRLTSIILLSYIVFIFYKCSKTDFNFEQWSIIFSDYYTKIFSLATVVSILIHAWIGLWTVTTDYLNSIYIRISAQFSIFLLLLFYLAWSIKILWSVS
jgi:succinate dehydrogenase / fumarate reductase membrane anchor subunit